MQNPIAGLEDYGPHVPALNHTYFGELPFQSTVGPVYLNRREVPSGLLRLF
mgnify:CR=1 FL=1